MAGMVISLHGVLGRAATCCKRSRDYKHLEFVLQELERHINMLRADPSPEMLKKFLDLYVDENWKPEGT